MVRLTLSLLAALLANAASAESNHKTLGLRVSTETVPLGATAHIKVFPTTPAPISRGYVTFTFNDHPSFETRIVAATVFGATGDVLGSGRYDGFAFVVSFSSPANGIGRLHDLPLIEFTFVADRSVAIGISLSAEFPSAIFDPDGRSYDLTPESIQPGGVQIDGTLSLKEVTPGGGIVPAGTTLEINGTGFTPQTSLVVENVGIVNTAFVSPTEMKTTLTADAEMTGRHIRVANPDGQHVDSWSWMQDGVIVPLISTISATWDVPTPSPGSLPYLGFENPGPNPIHVRVSNSYLPGGPTLGTNTFTILPWSPASVLVQIQSRSLIDGDAPFRVVGYVQDRDGVKGALPVSYTGTQAPLIGSIGSAASLTQGAVSPGEIITIFGGGIGPVKPAGLTLDEEGHVSSSVAEARVFFDGFPAPLLYVSQSQINVVVPYEVAGRESTKVVIEYGSVLSAPWDIPVGSVAPAIFTLDSSGQGRAAVLNQDNSLNGPGNPAPRGTVIQVFATGEGQTTPPSITGSVTGFTPNSPLLPVHVLIGGFDATVQFAGSAPGAIAGLLQVNAIVPASAPLGAAIPIVLTIGSVRSQADVTIAVK